jgi:ribosomal protein S18 acetylase RimI-like enzyme
MKTTLVSDQATLDECARLMTASEPWITLKRDFEKCRQSLTGDFREVHAILEEGKVIGFAVLQMKGTFTGYLQSICVAPGMRSKGVGKFLLEFVEEYIFQFSPNVFLCVSSFNERAAKLYEQSGYEKVGVIKNFIEDGFDEILMRKTLSSWNKFQQSVS